jgi:hypothetical protein
LSLWGVISPSLLIHGGVGLDRIRGHTRAPAKPHESMVYDCDLVGYLSCAQGSCISCSGGEIHRGVRGILQAWIRCATTLISPLSATVLRSGAASLDPLGILHMGIFVTLCEAYMGIEPHFDVWNYFFLARLQQGSDAEAAVLDSVVIFV